MSLFYCIVVGLKFCYYIHYFSDTDYLFGFLFFVGGLCIYRRSLRREPSNTEREKKLQRSRQQRVRLFCGKNFYMIILKIWDRRSKVITDEEMEKWKDIYPTMMSDEETLDNKNLKRRRPSWRSSEFNELMDELDQRSESNSKHPRKNRVIGTPLKNDPPTNAKEWMLIRAD